MALREVPPTLLVIFGVTGDLSRRYILPALKELNRAGQLPDNFRLIGVSRRRILTTRMFGSSETLIKISKTFAMDFTRPDDYKRLRIFLNQCGEDFKKKPQIIFYFALPPEAVLQAIKMMGKNSLNGPRVKLMLEKPFGTDFASAKQLIKQTNRYFKTSQAYMIDHYLAKEMAQNIIIFLGGNILFRDVWNRDYIDKIDVIVAEHIGIEGRSGFYEQTGALRDVIQSHGLQLAALVLMKPSSDLFNFSEVPARRLAAIKALKIDKSQPITRAQYQGYKKEVSDERTKVETFVSLTLKSLEERWKGVPIRLTTGKRLNNKLTAIDIYFKKSKAPKANKLTLRIQPDEAVELDLWVKEPGYSKNLKKRPLSFSYGQHFSKLPEAYEQILLDAFSSDQSLFASGDEVLASWRVLQPVLNRWQTENKSPKIYKPGATIEEVLSGAGVV